MKNFLLQLVGVLVLILDEAYLFVRIILEYYNENAHLGEKLGCFIDRITIDKFRNDIIKIKDLKEKKNDN